MWKTRDRRKSKALSTTLAVRVRHVIEICCFSKFTARERDELEPWGKTHRWSTYSQGQSNTVPIVNSDEKVFPTQTIWIYNLLKPNSENKNEVWINKLWRKPKRIFDFLPFLISWQLTSFWAGGGCLTYHDCPAQGGLKEGCRGQIQETSVGRNSSTFQQIRAWKGTKLLDT